MTATQRVCLDAIMTCCCVVIYRNRVMSSYSVFAGCYIFNHRTGLTAMYVHRSSHTWTPLDALSWSSPRPTSCQDFTTSPSMCVRLASLSHPVCLRIPGSLAHLCQLYVMCSFNIRHYFSTDIRGVNAPYVRNLSQHACPSFHPHSHCLP